jgi:hypothetical protein
VQQLLVLDHGGQHDTVGAVSDHADVGLALQQTLEAPEHDGMVVGDDDRIGPEAWLNCEAGRPERPGDECVMMSESFTTDRTLIVAKNAFNLAEDTGRSIGKACVALYLGIYPLDVAGVGAAYAFVWTNVLIRPMSLFSRRT